MRVRPWHGLVLLVMALGLLHGLLLYNYPFEDSYITFRYADNLLAGIGLRYNPGETVEGFTSFGWVMFLAGAGAIGLAIPLVAKVCSITFGVALLAVTTLLARRHARLPTPWVIGPALLLAANGTWAYYSMTGMETSLFALLVNLGLVVAIGQSSRHAVAAGLIMAVASMVRPEGVGYFGLLAIGLLTDRQGRRQLPLYLAAYGLLFVPYFAWRWIHFGYPLPNTYYAKASAGSGVFKAGLDHFEEYFTTHLFWLAPIAAVITLRHRADRWARLSAIVLAGAVVNVIFVGGDAFAFYRFLLPGLPAGALLIFAGGYHAATNASRPWLRSVLATCGVALIAWTAYASHRPRSSLTRHRPETQYERAHRAAKINDHYFLVGRWLRDTFPNETLLAINAAGIIPYEARLPTIDMLGLNDEHIAHLDIELGHGALGHEKHDAGYVLARKPDVILLGLPVLTHRPLRSPEELTYWFKRWFDYLPGDRVLFHHPDFQASYRPFSVQVQRGRWLTLFVRRGSEPARR